MRKYLFVLPVILFAVLSFAQVPYNSAVPNGYTKKAMVSEQVGLTEVAITYHRPAVKGREGKFGEALFTKDLLTRDLETAKLRRGGPVLTKKLLLNLTMM